MKRLVLVGALVGAVAASSAFAQTAEKPAGKASQGAGHAAPKTQPPTETAAAAPAGQVALGTVRIPKAIKADGKPLAAGTYQVRLTPETASPDARGQTASNERWASIARASRQSTGIDSPGGSVISPMTSSLTSARSSSLVLT